VKVVADASPLIALDSIGQFDLLHKLFERIIISSEVYAEVVIAGSGLPGSQATSQAAWIEIQPIKNKTALVTVQTRSALDIGELSTLVLATEIEADLVLMDDLAGRKLVRKEGFRVQGTVGILEASFVRNHLGDLREAFGKLLEKGVYLDREFLNSRLKALTLPPL
jgi:uncharacterized protein